jgi:hypothetical protein
VALPTGELTKREFITAITAEKHEKEKRKSTADFLSLMPRQQYYGCQSYTKSPCEQCQDSWEL